MEQKLNKFYYIYLTLVFIGLSIFSFYSKKHAILNEVILVLTLIQCYFMFHNIGKMVGIFSLTNSTFNGIVNFSNRMYTSFVYSIYGASVGLFLVLNGKNEQNKVDFKKTVFKLGIIFITGFVFFIFMNYKRTFSIVLIFDLLIFTGNMCGGYLASKQSLFQFVVFIPIGLIQIMVGIILNEPIFITTSLVYLFSDVLSIFKWIIVSKREFN